MKVEGPGWQALHKQKGLLLFTQTGGALGFLRNIDIPQQLSQISIIPTKHLILAMCDNSPSAEQTLLSLIRGAERKPRRCDTGLPPRRAPDCFYFHNRKTRSWTAALTPHSPAILLAWLLQTSPATEGAQHSEQQHLCWR